jgi:hypothetical protein
MRRLLVLFVVLVPVSLFIVGCGDGTNVPKVTNEHAAKKSAEMQKTMAETMKARKETTQNGPRR